MAYKGDMKELNKLQRQIPIEEREKRIHESSNIVGYGRFMGRNQQVQNQEAYRKPSDPEND